MIKHIIDTGQHRLPAPEVLLQFNHLARSPFPGICFVFIHEQLRPGQTEPVYALLHIPHHEHVGMAGPFPGNAGNQCFLDIVAVLIFVHQNFFILPAQLVCHLGRTAGNRLLPVPCFLPFIQNLQRQMLQIIKIQHVPLPLGIPVCLVEHACKP